MTATLSPLKNAGSAAGSLTRRMICQREAPKVRSMSTSVALTPRSPSARLTVIGKKHTRATTMSLGRMPRPNRITSSGAMAMVGTVCDTTSSG